MKSSLYNTPIRCSKQSVRRSLLSLIVAIVVGRISVPRAMAQDLILPIDSLPAITTDSLPTFTTATVALSDTVALAEHCSIYALPYSIQLSVPDWHRMWINTATLSTAFVGTLLVLECLPEDATSWNRAELRNRPFYKRWFKNVFKRGPEWDHDKFYFNYLLHPYAGAVYYLGARSCGFNLMESVLYCTCISTVGWEFGIEACMERPSIQDIFITPLVGSLVGEGFYRIKRNIVANDYCLWGSKALGHIAAFLVDPLNEFVSLFAGNNASATCPDIHLSTSPQGLSLVATF